MIESNNPAAAGLLVVNQYFIQQRYSERIISNVHFMLETLAIVLLVLWALGMVSSYTLGGLIHLLLVAAVVMVLFRLIQGRSPVV